MKKKMTRAGKVLQPSDSTFPYDAFNDLPDVDELATSSSKVFSSLIFCANMAISSLSAVSEIILSSHFMYA